MNWKTLALGFAMTGLAVGCGSTPSGSDGGNTGTDAGPGETRTYIIGAIDTEADGPSDTPDNAYGFDLDGIGMGPTTSCTGEPDFTSPITMAPQVDNQLAGLATVLDGVLGGDGTNGAVRDQILAGKVLLILQVSDINSYSNDDSVMVHAILGQVVSATCSAHADQTSCEADTTCAWVTGTAGSSCAGIPAVGTACDAHADQVSCEQDQTNACNWGLMSMACQGITAGQTFTTLMDLGTPVAGTITNGELSATTPVLPLMFSASGNTVTLTLHSVQFGGRISADTIVNGQFGARISVQELMDTAASLGFGSVDITGFVHPDLDEDPTDPTTCMSISAGMRYAALSATLN